MARVFRSSLIAAAVLCAGCGSDSPSANAANAAPANAAAAEGNAPATKTNLAAAPAAPAYALAADGLGPGLGFGLAQSRAIELATAAFGPPTGRQSLDCPQGAMDAVNFRNLQLTFDQDRFAGWTLDGAAPPLRTAGGIGFGTPRSGLGNVEISEERGFPEFSVGEMSGVLDGSGARVVSLYAGEVCQLD